MSAEDEARRPGRPLDPDLEARTYEAAIAIYGAVGWAGFTITAVAKRARVGKTAFYSRWTSKADLLVEATMSLDVGRPAPNTGSLREDLIETMIGDLQDYLSPIGLVKLRAQVEAKLYPELLGQAMERLRRHRLEGGKTIIANAVQRGELSSHDNGILLLDTIGGMAINHFLATPADRLPSLADHARRFAETGVDFALRAVSSPVDNSVTSSLDRGLR